MKICYLLDENLSPRIKLAILRYNKEIDILRVGDENAPSLGTSDPDILLFLERSRRTLVTDNRATMPEHTYAHLASGGHHWGILEVRPKTTVKELIDVLCLLWEASDAEEWIDQIQWIPF
ncbi:MAG: hypothetical protein GY749_12210 [Desulfobacteraceae bacterium]|nr:hypothetical protein [Desulfobacteraceae bacterium]